MINFFEPKIDSTNTLKYLGMVLKSNFLMRTTLQKTKFKVEEKIKCQICIVNK